MCKLFKTVAKQKRYVVRFANCSRAVSVRFSIVVVHLAAFLQQLCDNVQGYPAIVLRLLQDKCVVGKILRQLYEHLACLAAVMRQPCVSCGCRTFLRKSKQIAKKMNMSKILVLDVAAALQPCLSCVVVYYTLRMRHEKQNFVVTDRCMAVARLM